MVSPVIIQKKKQVNRELMTMIHSRHVSNLTEQNKRESISDRKWLRDSRKKALFTKIRIGIGTSWKAAT